MSEEAIDDPVLRYRSRLRRYTSLNNTNNNRSNSTTTNESSTRASTSTNRQRNSSSGSTRTGNNNNNTNDDMNDIEFIFGTNPTNFIFNRESAARRASGASNQAGANDERNRTETNGTDATEDRDNRFRTTSDGTRYRFREAGRFNFLDSNDFFSDHSTIIITTV